MAQRTTVMLVDDLDGSGSPTRASSSASTASATRSTSPTSTPALCATLSPPTSPTPDAPVAVAVRAPARRRASSTPTSSSTAAGGREQNQAIRDWAARHGHPLSTRVASRPPSAKRSTAATPRPPSRHLQRTTTPVVPRRSEQPTAGPSAHRVVDLASRPGRAHQRGARTHPGMGHRGRHRGQGPRPPQQGSDRQLPLSSGPSLAASGSNGPAADKRARSRTYWRGRAAYADLHDGGAVSGAHSRVRLAVTFAVIQSIMC